MKLDKSKYQSPSHKILIQVVDRTKAPIKENGQNIIYTKWYEVKEVNLGSRKNPQKDIIQIRFEPINYETKDKGDKFLAGDDYFKRLFG